MDERQTAKNALKIEYPKEIASQLVKEFNLSESAISSSGKGEIDFGYLLRSNSEPLYGFVRSLIAELANAKAELWLQSQSSKGTEQKQS